MRYATALAILLAAAPAAAQDGLDADAAERNGLTTCGGRPCLSAFDGGFTLTPRLRIDGNAGSFFGQDKPDGFRSGVNLRRGRLTAEGTALRDVGYRFTWDFGGCSPRDYSFPYEAQVNYSFGTSIMAPDRARRGSAPTRPSACRNTRAAPSTCYSWSGPRLPTSRPASPRSPPAGAWASGPAATAG